MGMSYSAGRPGKRRMNAEINVVPYIDVMLVLLIIFMVTAPLLTQGIEVELPQAVSEPMEIKEEPVVFSVDRKGQYFLNVGEERSAPLSDDELVQRVGAVMRNKPETLIVIEGDTAVDYGRVNKGMSLLQRAGAVKVGFRNMQPDAKPARK